MAFHDSAIVGYAETKIVEKSDKDVCALGAEILGSLIKSTGIEKDAIDGMILSSSMTGAGVGAATTAFGKSATRFQPCFGW